MTADSGTAVAEGANLPPLVDTSGVPSAYVLAAEDVPETSFGADAWTRSIDSSVVSEEFVRVVAERRKTMNGSALDLLSKLLAEPVR